MNTHESTVYRARCLATVILGLTLLGAVGNAAGELRYDLSPGEEKAVEPGFIITPVVFDCAVARDTLAVSRAYIDTIYGDTTGGQNLIPGYSCRPWNESGPEHVYRLDLPQSAQFSAVMSSLGDNDLDIFLLTDCDSETCLIGENTEITAGLDAGTYYLVIDGFGGDEGSYTLALSGRHPGVPEEVCEPGGAIEIVPGNDNLLLDENGDIYEQPNLIQAYTCNSYRQRGGEVWYAVTLPDSAVLDAQLTFVAVTMDASLWLFDGCGDSPVCLDFVDDFAAGQGESLAYTNDTGATATVYLAVDGFRPPENEFGGLFTLGGTVVETVHTSWSRLRGMYR